MKVLIIGAGNMGSGLARRLAAAGHQVRVTSRDMAKARALAQQCQGEAVSAAGAAAGQEAVILATMYADAPVALRSVGDLAGKVVIDITNPLTSDFMGLTVGHVTSGAEELAREVPGALLVKAFNTVFANVLDQGPDFGGGRKATVFLASDSAVAKESVRALALSIGFAVQDAGGLVNARLLEPLAVLNIYLGYGAGLGTDIAPAWIRRSE